MYLSHSFEPVQPVRERRRSPRLEIQCRARIHIGRRHYAGYVHNISRTGAKLRTISPIRRVGAVNLHLPDLPPLKCRLCWVDSYNAGVVFKTKLSASEFRAWAESRSAFSREPQAVELAFAEMLEIAD